MENETIEITDEVTCTACMSVPISHLQLEAEVPLAGWQPLFDELGIKTVTDFAGRAAILQLAARKLFQHLRRRDELAAEAHDRRAKQMAARYPVRADSMPAMEGMTPFESMVATGKVVSPAAEFAGSRPRPQFLQEALAEGAAADDEKRRAVAEKKQRLVDQMQEELGRKP